MDCQADIDDLGIRDEMIRCILNPKQNRAGTDIFDTESLLAPTKVNDVDKIPAQAISLGWKLLLSTDELAHAYGCRTAATATAAKKARFAVKGKAFNRPSDYVIYIGFFEVDLSALLSRKFDNAIVTLNPCVEHSEKAHCNLCITPATDDVTRPQFSQARLDVLNALSKALRGPTRHICPEDNDIRDYLERVTLPTLPVAEVSTGMESPTDLPTKTMSKDVFIAKS